MTADLASILQNHPDVSTSIKAFTVLLTNVSRLRSCLMKQVLKLRTFRSGASVDVYRSVRSDKYAEEQQAIKDSGVMFVRVHGKIHL